MQGNEHVQNEYCEWGWVEYERVKNEIVIEECFGMNMNLLNPCEQA